MFKGNNGVTILLFRICSELMQVLEKSFCFQHILNAMIYIFDFIHILRSNAGNQWTRSLIIFLGLVYVIVIAKPWKTRDCVSCFVFRKTFVFWNFLKDRCERGRAIYFAPEEEAISALTS